LPQTLRIETADAFHAQLKAACEETAATPLMLDASGVQTFGIAGIQLLLSAHKTASVAHRPLVLSGASEPFRDAWAMLGLAHEISTLKEPQSIPEEA
jgi:anti-anti-sigma regulatory factor